METVSAIDPDEGANGQFRYTIESGDPDDQFAIDGMNTFLPYRHSCSEKTEQKGNFKCADYGKSEGQGDALYTLNDYVAPGRVHFEPTNL